MKSRKPELLIQSVFTDMAQDNYLNDFHREHSERLKEHLARQPKASLKEALAQYERIKRGSTRR